MLLPLLRATFQWKVVPSPNGARWQCHLLNYSLLTTNYTCMQYTAFQHTALPVINRQWTTPNKRMPKYLPLGMPYGIRYCLRYFVLRLRYNTKICHSERPVRHSLLATAEAKNLITADFYQIFNPPNDYSLTTNLLVPPHHAMWYCHLLNKYDYTCMQYTAVLSFVFWWFEFFSGLAIP